MSPHHQQNPSDLLDSVPRMSLRCTQASLGWSSGVSASPHYVHPAPGSSDLSRLRGSFWREKKRERKEKEGKRTEPKKTRATTTQHDPLPWTSHRRKEFPKHATRASGERCAATARRVASSAPTSDCDASTRHLASRDHRAREAISFQNSEPRRPPRLPQPRPSCPLTQAKPPTRPYTLPFRPPSRATKPKPVGLFFFFFSFLKLAETMRNAAADPEQHLLFLL